MLLAKRSALNGTALAMNFKCGESRRTTLEVVRLDKSFTVRSVTGLQVD
jgi:hypothetical protein